MIETDKLRKEDQALQREIQDLKNQLKKVTCVITIFISFIILQTVNFPWLAFVLISYFAVIVLPQIALLEIAVGYASEILSVYK